MKVLLSKVSFMVFIIFSFQTAWALSIVTPKEGEIFYSGSKLDVRVKPDSGENWEKVLLEIVPMSYDFLAGFY